MLQFLAPDIPAIPPCGALLETPSPKVPGSFSLAYSPVLHAPQPGLPAASTGPAPIASIAAMTNATTLAQGDEFPMNPCQLPRTPYRRSSENRPSRKVSE